MLPDLMANLEQSPLDAWIFDYGLPTPPLIDRIAHGRCPTRADPRNLPVGSQACKLTVVLGDWLALG